MSQISWLIKGWLSNSQGMSIHDHNMLLSWVHVCAVATYVLFKWPQLRHTYRESIHYTCRPVARHYEKWVQIHVGSYAELYLGGGGGGGGDHSIQQQTTMLPEKNFKFRNSEIASGGH